MTVAQLPEKRPCTNSTKIGLTADPDLKALKKFRSAMLTAGTGQASDELISTPSASNTLTPATSECPATLDLSTSCHSGVAICRLKTSGELVPARWSCATVSF